MAAGTNADLIATIGADVTPLQNGLRDGTVSLNGFAQSTEAASQRAQRAMAGLNQSSNRAGFALTNLGRVAQDAPFGFIAIQNNISPLVDSFGSLVRETGSVGGAFRSLGSALAGPAGIGLAIAAVTSAITLYVQYQQRANSELKNAKKSADDYINTLDGVTAAHLRGAEAGANETVRLKILYDAATNSALGIGKQNEAYTELNKLYPAVFTNQARNATLAGNGSAAYEKLTASIIAAAKAHAYEQQIGKNATRQIENEQKVNDLIAKRGKLQTEQAKKQAGVDNISGVAGPLVGLLQAHDPLSRSLTDVKDDISNVNTEISHLNKDSNLLTLQNNLLQARAIAQEAAAAFKTAGELNDKIPKEAKHKPTDIGLSDYGTNPGTFKITTPVIIGNTEAVLDNLKAWQANSAAQMDLNAQSAIRLSQWEAEQSVIAGVTDALGTGLVGAFQAVISGSQSFLSAFGQVIIGIIEKLVAAIAVAAILAALLPGGFAANFSSNISKFSGIAGLGQVITGGGAKAVGGSQSLIPAGQTLQASIGRGFASAGNSSTTVLTSKISGPNIILASSRQDKINNRLT